MGSRCGGRGWSIQRRGRRQFNPNCFLSRSAQLRQGVGWESCFSPPYHPGSAAQNPPIWYLPTPSTPPCSLPRFQCRSCPAVELPLRYPPTGAPQFSSGSLIFHSNSCARFYVVSVSFKLGIFFLFLLFFFLQFLLLRFFNNIWDAFVFWIMDDFPCGS